MTIGVVLLDGTDNMLLCSLYKDVIIEGLNHAQLDRIINDIKQDLKTRGFIKAVYHQMNRYGYGQDATIFKQIGDEMRRRSKISGVKSRKPNLLSMDYKRGTELAASVARKRYEEALAGTPDVDEFNEFDFIADAAYEFGVSDNDVLKAIRALRT